VVLIDCNVVANRSMHAGHPRCLSRGCRVAVV